MNKYINNLILLILFVILISCINIEKDKSKLIKHELIIVYMNGDVERFYDYSNKRESYHLHLGDLSRRKSLEGPLLSGVRKFKLIED
jgi:hypothetical protein